jgi:hypothetical protein
VQAQGLYTDGYLHYSDLRRALRFDCEAVDGFGKNFEQVRSSMWGKIRRCDVQEATDYCIQAFRLPQYWQKGILAIFVAHSAFCVQQLSIELLRVNAHYRSQVHLLSQAAASIEALPDENVDKILPALRQHVQTLSYFIALNYTASVRAIQKRNDRLARACGSNAAVRVKPYIRLRNEDFFSSPELAAVTARTSELSMVRCLAARSVTLLSQTLRASITKSRSKLTARAMETKLRRVNKEWS